MESEALRKTIGRRLREIRKALGKTQAELAVDLKISKPTYVRYEAGELFPNMMVLANLRESFEVDMDWLIAGSGGMFLPREKVYYLEMNEKVRTDIRYLELEELMHIPAIEQVIFSKLEEVKRIFKEDIEELQGKSKKPNEKPPPGPP